MPFRAAEIARLPAVSHHDPDRGDPVATERFVGSPADLLVEETGLRSPGSGRRRDRQDARFEGRRGGLGGEPVTDDGRPCGGELRDRHAACEELICHQRIDDIAELDRL
jgi:hypothetical protein